MSNITIEVQINLPSEVIDLIRKFLANGTTEIIPEKKKKTPAPAVETEETDNTLTLVDLRKQITPVSDKSPELREKVKNIIKKHGADSLKLLDAKHYAAVLKKVLELDAKQDDDL